MASQDHDKNLETLALFISPSVRSAMMASYVTFAANGMFSRHSDEDQRKLFRKNPANTLTYSSLSALVERSIVHVSETLKDEHKIHPISVEIRRKLDLALHRDAVSHPATVEWRNRRMQDFADADRGTCSSTVPRCCGISPA